MPVLSGWKFAHRSPSQRQTLDAICTKIKRETPRVTYVGLFSWTEPLLHPELASLVAIVKKHNLPCHLSSNLNRIERLEEVIAARPDRLRISLSGFTQEIYGQSHRGGDIEKVKANMHRLREILDDQGSTTQVFVSYHRYNHNMGEDYDQMRALTARLGFEWEPVWAYFMPLEKNLSFFKGNVADDDRQIIELLAVSPDEQRARFEDTPASDCRLRSHETSINADGSVALCCATFDKAFTIAPSFLETAISRVTSTQIRALALQVVHGKRSSQNRRNG